MEVIRRYNVSWVRVKRITAFSECHEVEDSNCVDCLILLKKIIMVDTHGCCLLIKLSCGEVHYVKGTIQEFVSALEK